jgi:hypothetical protein
LTSSITGLAPLLLADTCTERHLLLLLARLLAKPLQGARWCKQCPKAAIVKGRGARWGSRETEMERWCLQQHNTQIQAGRAG